LRWCRRPGGGAPTGAARSHGQRPRAVRRDPAERAAAVPHATRGGTARVVGATRGTGTRLHAETGHERSVEDATLGSRGLDVVASARRPARARSLGRPPARQRAAALAGVVT